MLEVNPILRMQDEATDRWHRDKSAPHPADPHPGLFTTLILAHHHANFDLWHQEDDARSPEASDAAIAAIKHAIDRLNQTRNDLVEQIDNLLLAEAGPQNDSSPLNSESPGLIIDRLSILALKLYHTAAEAHRASASEAQRAINRRRLDVLEHQRTELAGCLDALWTEVLAGRRHFHLYRQMKMYNDPDLNPVLYRRAEFK